MARASKSEKQDVQFAFPRRSTGGELWIVSQAFESRPGRRPDLFVYFRFIPYAREHKSTC